MGPDSERDAVKQAIGILDNAKKNPYPPSDEDKAVQEVQTIIEKNTTDSRIDITRPEYQRLAKILTKLAPIQRQLEEKHRDEQEYEEVVREEYVKPRAEEKIPSQKVKLILGKNEEGKTYIRTELLDFLVVGKDSINESVQIIDEGNGIYTTEKHQFVMNYDNQEKAQHLVVKSNEPAKARIDTFYKHTETIVPPTPIVEKSIKLMRRIFKR